MIPIRPAAVLALLLALGGCLRVHHREESFAWAQTDAGEVRVQVLCSGKDRLEDSAGLLLERRTRPYRVGVYLAGRGSQGVRVARVTFRGRRSGTVVAPAFGPAREYGDAAGGRVSVAPGVPLPDEDLDVRILLWTGPPDAPVAREVRGTLSYTLRASTGWVLREVLTT